ncbi:hypothetical protein pb186bvf_015860 [Paramecium bursaria]
MNPNQITQVLFIILLLLHIVKLIIYYYQNMFTFDEFDYLNIMIALVSLILIISLIILIFQNRFRRFGQKNRILKQFLDYLLIVSFMLMILIFFSYLLQIVNGNNFYNKCNKTFIIYCVLEIILTDVWICFLFNLIIQNNGIFKNVLSKFGYFGVIKQIVFIVLDIETILLQLYIIVISTINFQATQVIIFSTTLMINILFTLYISYYQIRQVFKLFGIGNMTFYKYNMLLKGNLVFLFGAFLLGFIYYFKFDLDKLFLFYLYSSFRLFNLSQNAQNTKFREVLLQQQLEESLIKSMVMDLDNIQVKCHICDEEFIHLDKLIYHTHNSFVYHKDCYRNQYQNNKLDLLSINSLYNNYECQVKLNSECHIQEIKDQKTLIINIIISASNFLIRLIGNRLVFGFYFIDEQNYVHNLCVIGQQLLFVLYILNNASQLLIQYMSKKIFNTFKIYLILVMYIFQFEGLYQLIYAQYYQLDQQIYNITQYFLICIIQAILLTEFMLIRNPFQVYRAAFTLNFFRSQMTHQLIFQIYFIYLILNKYVILLLQIIPFNYYVIYVIYWDIHQIISINDRKKQLPFYYNIHRISSQFFLITSSLQYIVFSYLDIELKSSASFILRYFFLFFGSTIITFRIFLMPKQKEKSSERFGVVKSSIMSEFIIRDFDWQFLQQCQMCFEQTNHNKIYYLSNCGHGFHQTCYKKFNEHNHKQQCPRCIKLTNELQVKNCIKMILL